jgi:endoglucanase
VIRIASVLRGLVLTAALAGFAAAEPFTPIDATAQTAAMGGGVNVLGYDPGWEHPGQARFVPQHFARIQEGGFKTVRVVLQAFRFMGPDNTLSPGFLATLDTHVKAALAAGLIVILDEHDFTQCAEDPAACRVKLKAFWQQIALRYKDAPGRLLFEIMNEPHGTVTDEMWNDMLAENLAIIRATNPTRNVVIGPGHYNSLASLPALKLPEADRHIIVTFHYYTPMEFTHQGATWGGPQLALLHGIAWGTPAEYKILDDDFDTVKKWAGANRRPVFLGEFGAYEPAAMEYRVKWAAAVREAAVAHGFAWAWWEFDGGFAVWDFSKPGWVDPIWHALIPPKAAK